MEMMEIVLLIAGGIIFILSFFIPDKKYVSGQKDGSAESVKALAEGELKGLISQEMDSIRTHVDDVVEEAVTYAMEKTERSLERLSNEKIMAVSEYSDTVLAEIHKNHEEAMFLYDMLNSKHVNLKNTVSEVNRTVKEAEATVMNFQKLAPEALSASEERILSRAPEPTARREYTPFEQAQFEQAHLKQAHFEPGRLTQEGFGAERTGTERTGTERTGIERLGTGKSGIERLGTGKSGTERSGMEKTTAERSETDNFGRVNSGTDRSGTRNIAMDNSTSGKSGIESANLEKSILEKNIVQKNRTEKSGLERLGAPAENVSLGKVSFMQEVDEQGRNNNERILELFQQGRSTVAIARELGLGVGEVKLVIDLFKNQ